MQHQDYSRKRADVNMRQHPIAKRTSAPAVNLLAQRIRHDGRDTKEADETSQPPHRQPGSSQHAIESARHQTGDYSHGGQHNQDRAANMKRLRQWIAFVNVASKRLRLITED